MSWRLDLPGGEGIVSMSGKHAKGNCAACAPERVPDSPKVSGNALRLATNDRIESLVWNLFYRYHRVEPYSGACGGGRANRGN
jgi:hypothetical protein